MNDDGQAVIGATIDANSTEGQDFLENEIVAPNPLMGIYMLNGFGGEKYDFKSRGIDGRPLGVSREQFQYRGSITRSGKFGSARDFGNIAAGIIAGRRGLTWSESRLGFDGLQSLQEGRRTSEGIPTQKAQRLGFGIGVELLKQDSYHQIPLTHSKKV